MVNANPKAVAIVLERTGMSPEALQKTLREKPETLELLRTSTEEANKAFPPGTKDIFRGLENARDIRRQREIEQADADRRLIPPMSSATDGTG